MIICTVHSENDLPIYPHICLITILAVAVLEIIAQEHAYRSQHETILADLN